MVFSYEEIPASLARPKLRLFLDTASPFSYFAAVVILRYKDDPKSPWKGKVDMEFIPSDLVEIRKRADNFPGPPAIRKKARYLAQDMHRNRRTYRLDLIPNPAAFPAKTGENLLLLAHVKINYPESVLQEAVMNLFEAYWTHNKDPALDVVMEETVGKAIGGSDKVREILASIRKDGREEKKWLERWTTEAANAHSFGAPWLHAFRTVNGKTEMQVFFGSDRFDHIADFFDLPWNGYVLSPETTPMPPAMDWPPKRKAKL